MKRWLVLVLIPIVCVLGLWLAAGLVAKGVVSGASWQRVDFLS
jgi:hypothetical protein